MEGLTVIGFPVAGDIGVPPQLSVYQYTVPTASFAVNCVLPPLQIIAFVTEIDVGFTGAVMKLTSFPYVVPSIVVAYVLT